MAAERLIRVTHREREDTVEELRAAYATGCLDEAELEERTSLAYAAKTRGDLAGLVSDLPPVPPSETAATVAVCPARRDWAGWARQSLGWGCWLVVAAAGAWTISAAAGGVLAVPLIFAWLVSMRLCGLLLRHRH